VKNVDRHIEFLINDCHIRIDKYLKNTSTATLITKHVEMHYQDPDSNFLSFQKFYFETVNNEKRYYDADFFNKFRTSYSLRGIDNITLNKYGKKKEDLLQLIREDRLSDLYSIFTEGKHYGSFFTKMVHTFNPDKYTPVDNPMREYFKLTHESYFISMVVISAAFLKWIYENRDKMDELKKGTIEANRKYIQMETDNISGIKVLDMIFWSEADNPTIKKNK